MYNVNSLANNSCKGVIFLKKKKNCIPVAEKGKKIFSMQNCATDPNGSYTGVPENPCEVPVQDADDL